jgi:hypothetical protein
MADLETVHATIDHTGITGVGGGGIASGTSFPGSPTTGDLFHRTDLAPALYRYDGTRWLTVQQFTKSLIPLTLPDYSTDGTKLYAPMEGGTDCWLDSFTVVSRSSVAMTGSNYWTLKFQKAVAAGTATDVANRVTSGDTNQFVCAKVAIGAMLGTTSTWVVLAIVKSGSGPNINFLACSVQYRIVAT